MITVKSVSRANGNVILTLEYTTGRMASDHPVPETAMVEVDDKDLFDRLRRIRQLQPTRRLQNTDIRHVIIGIVEELRRNRQAVTLVYPYEDYIGLDLET